MKKISIYMTNNITHEIFYEDEDALKIFEGIAKGDVKLDTKENRSMLILRDKVITVTMEPVEVKVPEENLVEAF